MSSPLVAFLGALETLIESLTPPDRAEVLYQHVDGTSRPSGSSNDRMFWVDGPATGEPNNQRGAELTTYRYTATLRVLFTEDGYSIRDRFLRVANESALILRAIEKHPENAWGSGVVDVQTEGFALERGRKNETAILAIALSIWTEETD